MAKIYGTPIMAGGGGGANKDLPPLLDNFKAVKGGGTKLRDLPNGTKVKFGTYNSQTLVWRIAQDEGVTKAVLDLNYDTGKTVLGDMAHCPAGIDTCGNWAITGWLNATEAGGNWWSNRIKYSSSPADTEPTYSSQAGFLNGWSDADRAILQTVEWDCNDDVEDGYAESYVMNAKVMVVSDNEAETAWAGERFSASLGGYTVVTRTYDNATESYSSTSGMGTGLQPAFMRGDLSSAKGVWPACAPNPDAVVSATTDDDECYTIDYENLYITIQADKMATSRANELAGAVWVYADHEPTSVNDGTKIQLTREEVVTSDGGEAQTVTKTVEWNNEANFFARQFTYNSKKQYQTMLEGAIAKIYSGQRITELPSGSKVKLGKWNNTDLQWKVARDTSDQSVRLVLEPTSVSLLGDKMYDNKEPSNSDTNRRKYGNNRYIYSNIHQWLNATKATGWYTAQHSTDAAPDYSSQAGFLSGWSENHIAALDRATLTVSRSSTDGGGTETFVSRVALMSTTELGLESGTGNGRLDIFNSDGDRATVSVYWTRTPHPSGSSDVAQVNKAGKLVKGYAINARAVRPLCIPKSTTYVSLRPDSDGCYTITGVNE